MAEGYYKKRKSPIFWLMMLTLGVGGAMFLFQTIVNYIGVARSTPEISLYINGGLTSVIMIAQTLFFADFMLGEYSPNLFRDPALFAFVFSVCSLIPLFFGLYWYWDLGVNCVNGSQKPIEVPMCTTSASGGQFIVWSNAASYTVQFIVSLGAIVLTFIDLYFRRFASLTDSSLQAVKGATEGLIPKGLRKPLKLLEGNNEDLKEYVEQGEGIEGMMDHWSHGGLYNVPGRPRETRRRHKRYKSKKKKRRKPL